MRAMIFICTSTIDVLEEQAWWRIKINPHPNQSEIRQGSNTRYAETGVPHRI